MKKYYIGITIGPIFDTVREASTPAALWFASRMFSEVTKLLCDKILKLDGYLNIEIHSPYYSEEIRTDDGVGKFHDRVIVSAESASEELAKEKLMDDMNAVIAQVKEEITKVFPKKIMNEDRKQFFNQYLQIHAIVLEECEVGNENCVLVLSPYLDCLELMKTFPADNYQNPIRRTFMGEKENRNVYIKESALFQDIKAEENQFKSPSGSIWSIEEIASCHGKTDMAGKASKYYAVIHADGDGMGTFLSGLGNDKISGFSRACLKYAEAAADEIAAYEGMTIYAGGDDLLFLAPVVNAKGKNIFELCNEIRNLFAEILRQETCLAGAVNLPTISFGIAIRYKKFPLYEALEASRSLLYIAKGLGGEKNRMAIDVQKHSGQSAAVAVSNRSCDQMIQLFKIGQEEQSAANMETVAQSLLTSLHAYRPILQELSKNVKSGQIQETQFLKSWMNFFDNPDQKRYLAYFEEMGNAFYEYFLSKNSEKHIDALVWGAQNKDPELISFEALLRIKKFLNEKGDEV